MTLRPWTVDLHRDPVEGATVGAKPLRTRRFEAVDSRDDAWVDLYRSESDLIYSNDLTADTDGWAATAGTFDDTPTGGQFSDAGGVNAFRDFGASDVDFQWDETYQGDIGGAVVRYADTANHIRMFYTTTVAVLDYRAGAGSVSLSSAGITAVSGNTYTWRIVVVADSLDLYFEGTVIDSITLPAGTDGLELNTSHGFRKTSGTDNRWTNVTVRTP